MIAKWFRRTGYSVVAVFVFCLIAGCGDGKKGRQQADASGVPDSFPRTQTLYVGGFQWGPPASFNPLAVTPAWPVTGNMNLIYEALFGYDLLDGSLKGIIGKSYAIRDSVMEIELYENARWQNGVPLTTDDVIYSYTLHKKYATNFSTVWDFITDIIQLDDHRIEFTLNQENDNPLIMRDIIASVQILPRKVFEALEKESFEKIAAEAGTAPTNADVLNKVREWKNDEKPLGSGPYTLETYTDDRIVLKRFDNYWGNSLYGKKPPAPIYIIHRAYESNDKFNQALQEGNLDISQTFCPKIWEKFEYGVGTWYANEPYYIPGIIPALLMSVTKKPFSDVNFRRAAAHAIDYEKIRTEALYGYSPELQPGLIVPFGTEKEFFSADDAVSFGRLYDPDEARRILKEAGYTWGADGMLTITTPKGKPITLYATCPKGWTDWEATIKIAVAGMRSIGINVQEKFLEYPDWDNSLKSGMFDFSMKTPLPEQAASLPWSRFDQVMSSKNVLPVGEVMYRNEGRYRNERADRLLAAIPKISDPTTLKQTYRELNRLFMSEMPIIPLMYRPWLFYQFNTTYWSNFPTDKNPYAPPQCLMVGAGVRALWGIVPSGSN
ncbi:MAG: ABC transporter substrate-binding protein [Chitinispirillaceae bacterium]|nr:ABC transporter substrate-binding protein [Chitinispirillaceae bacterium]